jgi:hypothetical protein
MHFNLVQVQVLIQGQEVLGIVVLQGLDLVVHKVVVVEILNLILVYQLILQIVKKIPNLMFLKKMISKTK